MVIDGAISATKSTVIDKLMQSADKDKYCCVPMKGEKGVKKNARTPYAHWGKKARKRAGDGRWG